jgi:hypothetical protein
MIDAGSDPDLWRFLHHAGFSEQQIASMSPETRLYHDLGLDGDGARSVTFCSSSS